jgi:hypothetical protein
VWHYLRDPMVITAAWFVAAVILSLVVARRLHEQHCQSCPKTGCVTVERLVPVPDAGGQWDRWETQRLCETCSAQLDAELQAAGLPVLPPTTTPARRVSA